MPTLPSIRTSIENNQSLVIDSLPDKVSSEGTRGGDL